MVETERRFCAVVEFCLIDRGWACLKIAYSKKKPPRCSYLWIFTYGQTAPTVSFFFFCFFVESYPVPVRYKYAYSRRLHSAGPRRHGASLQGGGGGGEWGGGGGPPLGGVLYPVGRR